MTIFDRAFEYQFVVLSQEPLDELVGDVPGALRETLEARVDGVDVLGLKLQPPAEHEITVLQPGVAQSSRGWRWSTASRAWRIQWAPQRFEAVFNARGYADAREEDVLPLDLVRRRIVGNLLRACTVAGQRVDRLALIVSGESSSTDRNVQEVIASLYFNLELQRAAAEGSVVDLTARSNLQTHWELGGLNGSPYRFQVNRLETASALGVLRGSQMDTYLQAQFDINSPATTRLCDGVEATNLPTFFARAVEWADTRLRALEDACRRR